MTDKALANALDKIAAALRGVEGLPQHEGDGFGIYPISHAIYDIAKAITDHSAPDHSDIVAAIETAGRDIETGLEAIARAINQASSE